MLISIFRFFKVSYMKKTGNGDKSSRLNLTVKTRVTNKMTKIRFLPITMTFYTILDDIHSSVNYKPRQTVIPPRISSVRYLLFALDFYDINKIHIHAVSQQNTIIKLKSTITCTRSSNMRY